MVKSKLRKLKTKILFIKTKFILSIKGINCGNNNLLFGKFILYNYGTVKIGDDCKILSRTKEYQNEGQAVSMIASKEPAKYTQGSFCINKYC